MELKLYSPAATVANALLKPLAEENTGEASLTSVIVNTKSWSSIAEPSEALKQI